MTANTKLRPVHCAECLKGEPCPFRGTPSECPPAVTVTWRQVVLCCGSREWRDRETIREWLKKLPPNTTIVHGAAPGADTMVDEEARAIGLEVRKYPADWAGEGKAAGPLRNQQMLDQEHPSAVLAFACQLMRNGRPRGTLDMVLRAHGAGVRVTIIAPKRQPVQDNADKQVPSQQ